MEQKALVRKEKPVPEIRSSLPKIVCFKRLDAPLTDSFEIKASVGQALEVSHISALNFDLGCHPLVRNTVFTLTCFLPQPSFTANCVFVPWHLARQRRWRHKLRWIPDFGVCQRA